MLKSSASRGVLVMLLAIAVFELSLTGKFTQIWQLAFVGSPSAAKPTTQQPTQQPGSTGVVPDPQQPIFTT